MLFGMPALTTTSFPLVPAAATDATGAAAVALDRSTTRFRLRNNGPNDVYWSTATGVTALAAGNGYPLVNGEESEVFGKEAQTNMDLFFVCDAAETASVKILEEK